MPPPSSPPARCLRAFLALWLLWLFPCQASHLLPVRNQTFYGDYNIAEEDFDWFDYLNPEVNAPILYQLGYYGQGSRVAIVEGGLVWDLHDVFEQRREGIPIPLGPGMALEIKPPTFDQNSHIPSDPETAPEIGQYDNHATMVASILGGAGLTPDGELSALYTGIAPGAEMQSGSIATTWERDENDELTGGFDISKESFLKPYVDYFTGGDSGTLKMDVINSSWGGSDPDGRSRFYTAIMDALAAENPDVASVVAAGNSGEEAPPAGPASGYNVISVGALTPNDTAGHSYDRPWPGTVGAPLDFYNPETGETIPGVRAGVHIAAPGSHHIVAGYLPDDPAATDTLYANVAGTSLAAPIVSGGIALLKEVARVNLSEEKAQEAMDTRVVRSVLMAGATATVGWDNGQRLGEDGVIRTTQALDYQVGAGKLDLYRSAITYVNPVGEETENLALFGWDLGTVNLEQTVQYALLESDRPFELTISLNWFAQALFDEATQTAEDLWLANLNLSLWQLGTEGDTLIAESVSPYGTSEFLRLWLLPDTQYGIRITYAELTYDLTGTASTQPETYGVAWTTHAVPEPGTVALLLWVAGVALLLHRRRRALRQ